MSDASDRPACAFDPMLGALRAAGEPTRLRLLAILDQGELNVSDLTEILGQSQPRISRHLKLLAEAGLIERIREGSWAFFRLSETGTAAPVVGGILSALDRTDRVLVRDQARVAEVRRDRASAASAYFDRHARDWDRIRALQAADHEVEAALLRLVGPQRVQTLLDLGTGTGRMLELLAPLAVHAVGVDASAGMLAVARANLERAGMRNAVVRQGDLFALPVEPNAYDLVIIHQVLHYLDDGGRAVREAARTLRPAGRLIVVDFAPHDLEFLREAQAHRRLGFARETVEGWMSAAGLEPGPVEAVSPEPGSAARLTVTIWTGRDARQIGDPSLAGSLVADTRPTLEVA